MPLNTSNAGAMLPAPMKDVEPPKPNLPKTPKARPVKRKAKDRKSS